MTRKICPFFNCTNVIKYRLQNGRQRYRCATCNHTWTSAQHPERRLKVLWRKYAFDGRSVWSLANEYKTSESSIRSQLRTYLPTAILQKPRIVAVIMDVTHFGSCGILVVIDLYANTSLGENYT